MRNLLFFKGALLVASLLAAGNGYCQRAWVKGVLVDSLTSEGEPFSTIRIYRLPESEKPVAMTVTDMDGRFAQELGGQGRYEILFSAVGRESKRIPFALSEESVVDLDTIRVSESSERLAGVEVVAQRPVVRMEVDKMSYSTADDADAHVSTVLEMLRKVPMVTVDGNDNITVNGSSDFKVYVDGRPNAMMSGNPSAVLKGMPASSVKRIEVITNPGVRYDAEGVGGVLNLVMNETTEGKRALDGYNATIRGMAATRGFSGGAYVGIRRGKLSLSLNANISNGRMDGSSVVSSRESFAGTGSLLEDNRLGDTRINMKMANLSAGYEIDSLRSLSASVALMGFDNNSAYDTYTSAWGDAGKAFGYGGWTSDKNHNLSINGSVDYRHSFGGSGRPELTLSYLLSASPVAVDGYSLFDEEAVGSSLDLLNRHTDAHRNMLENTFQTDLALPLSTDHRLNTGLKYILRDNRSDSKFYQDPDRLGNFQYDALNSLNYRNDNRILGVYAEYEGAFQKWSWRGGLRYEQTWQKVRYVVGQGEDFSLRYGNWVPSANLSYRLSDSQNMGLTYNMRINRPGISYLNPYVDRSDPTRLTYGNARLDCEWAHNLSLVYNLSTPKWTLNLTLRQGFRGNAIESYSFYKDNLLNTTYGNIASERQTGLSAYLNWNISPSTRVYLNGNLSYVNWESERLDLSNAGWQANATVGIRQLLPWKLSLNANMMTSSQEHSLQGWSSGFNMAMASLSRSFFRDKLSVSVTGGMPLRGKNLVFESFTRGNDFSNRTKLSLPVRMVGVSVSYTFGSRGKEPKPARSRSIRNTDLKESHTPVENIGNMFAK